MDRSLQGSHSYLFTVRVWQEEVRAGQTEWRGMVQLMSSGEVRYFREWATLAPLLLAMVAEWESQSEAPRDVRPSGDI
jgi:hypothetical protein